MTPAAAEPPNLSREQLYENWYSWVTSNLGRNERAAAIAADAAVDSAVHGHGFNAAAAAATAAWREATAGAVESGINTRGSGGQSAGVPEITPPRRSAFLRWAPALAALLAWLGQGAIVPLAYTEFVAHNSQRVVDLSALLRLPVQMQDYAILAGVLLACSVLALSFGLALDGRPRAVWLTVAALSSIPLLGLPQLAGDTNASGVVVAGFLMALGAPLIAVPALVWAMRKPARSYAARVAIVLALLSLMTWGFSTCAAGDTFNPPQSVFIPI